MKSVGIVGGLGPETTSKFYLDLISLARKHCDSYPKIIIDNVSFPFYLEEEIIKKSENEHRILPYLEDSIRKLNKAGVDFIVIPCNTVHIFIEDLRRISKVPILSILDETIKVIKKEGYRKIGLLATTKTIDRKLYETPLVENGINIAIPTKTEQEIVAKIILRILENTSDGKDKMSLLKIIDNLFKRGSESILLGCTDLQLILNQSDLKTKLIDTANILMSATFNKLSDINQNTEFKGR